MYVYKAFQVLLAKAKSLTRRKTTGEKLDTS